MARRASNSVVERAARAATDRLVEKLRSARSDYDTERVWHRFLLDAYAGCGGFAGKVRPPSAGYLGWASDVYSTPLWQQRGTETFDTYLDRFPREDAPKFERRIDVAHYVNYVGPIADLFCSYLSSQPPTRQGLDDSTMADWLEDADGRGTSWNELRDETIMPRALQLGWCPVMFDRDPTPDGVKSRAHEKALDLRTRAIPLFPANVLEWQTDDSGSLLWVKIKLTYCEKVDPLGAEQQYDKFLIWTTDTVSEYRVVEREDGKPVVTTVRDKQPHGFGCVPLVVFRAGRSEDPVRGISMVGAVAVENRRHFNLLSELDEHLRSTVFALLQVPIPEGSGGDGGDEGAKPAEIVAGAGNAVGVPANATQGYAFIAPPGSVAATYEKRLEATTREIYRIASAPYEDDAGGAESGTARAYKFEGTNKRLVKVAKGMAHGDQASLQLVMRSQGVDEATVDKLRCSAPADFRVDDLSVDLDNLIKAVSVAGMAPTAKMHMVLRAVQKMLPNAHADQLKVIEAELAKRRDAEAAAPIVLAAPAPTVEKKPKPSTGSHADDGNDNPPPDNQQQAA
jgi:hypothetical protein